MEVTTSGWDRNLHISREEDGFRTAGASTSGCRALEPESLQHNTTAIPGYLKTYPIRQLLSRQIAGSESADPESDSERLNLGSLQARGRIVKPAMPNAGTAKEWPSYD